MGGGHFGDGEAKFVIGGKERSFISTCLAFRYSEYTLIATAKYIF